ncbi:hypothetical protein H2199_001733 [Coniosporium tulheliwenetii]|uniref:Uncharacterized protein n=1 Tax=Coniosporium tulheliwenetii TaxID=3383036 RepID=A0ACC2ZK51_9PEZI|nr:hypothetical protein H2199_001733 [Cladosporium sp. JES 115]
MDFDSLSNASSRLSSPASRSPTPPSDFYLTPPPSQQCSNKSTPLPESMACSDDDNPRPAKRCKLTREKSESKSDSKSRPTEYLDLTSDKLDDDEEVQLRRLIKALHNKRKIVVIAGAGISVSAGIPDFRSSKGLFKSLKAQHNLKSSGKDLFDASVYRDGTSTSVFHDMVRELSHATKSAKPTAFHHLVATLAKEGRLLRLYSQNVDGLDTCLPPLATEVPLKGKAPWPKTIQLHGGLDNMVCSKCNDVQPFQAALFDGEVPPLCGVCEALDRTRTVHAGKRSHGVGKLRPRMVLYNEHNPDDEAIGSVTRADLKTYPDAVIVAGTTLKVPGVRRIVREMCTMVRNRRDGLTVWVNNDPEPSGKDLEDCWDLVVTGPCDEVARHAALPRWDDEEVAKFKVVTDEEVQKVKEETGMIEVVVVSPKKRKTPFEPLPTPIASPITPMASPQLLPQLPKKAGQSKLPSTPTKSRRTTPATKGKSIAEVLAASSKNAKAVPKKAPAITKGGVAVKKATAGKPNTKITSAFGVSKAASTIANDAAKSKAKPPLAKGKGDSIPMGPISPQDPRNNHSLPLDAPLSLSIVTSIETPESMKSEGERGGTISPTGYIPSSMRSLLH